MLLPKSDYSIRQANQPTNGGSRLGALLELRMHKVYRQNQISILSLRVQEAEQTVYAIGLFGSRASLSHRSLTTLLPR